MSVRKNKNVNINGNPLEPISIGQVKENKYGWIGVIIIFGLFIAIPEFYSLRFLQMLINPRMYLGFILSSFCVLGLYNGCIMCYNGFVR